MKEGEEAFLEHATQGAALRRRRGGDGVRRAGPGRHHRAQGRDLRARLQAADREGRLSARGHHLRSQHLRRRHRHRGAQRLRLAFIEATRQIKAEAAARARLGRRLQPVVLVPRQRGRAPGDALGVPVPRHRRRPRHGDRQRRPDHHLRRHRARAARAVRGRDPQPAGRRHRPAAGGGRHATRARTAKAKEKDLAWRDAPVEERLKHALVHGINDYIEADTEAARRESPTSPSR